MKGFESDGRYPKKAFLIGLEDECVFVSMPIRG